MKEFMTKELWRMLNKVWDRDPAIVIL
jgi:hypothetical protein